MHLMLRDDSGWDAVLTARAIPFLDIRTTQASVPITHFHGGGSLGKFTVRASQMVVSVN